MSISTDAVRAQAPHQSRHVSGQALKQRPLSICADTSGTNISGKWKLRGEGRSSPQLRVLLSRCESRTLPPSPCPSLDFFRHARAAFSFFLVSRIGIWPEQWDEGRSSHGGRAIETERELGMGRLHLLTNASSFGQSARRENSSQDQAVHDQCRQQYDSSIGRISFTSTSR